MATERTNGVPISTASSNGHTYIEIPPYIQVELPSLEDLLLDNKNPNRYIDAHNAFYVGDYEPTEVNIMTVLDSAMHHGFYHDAQEIAMDLMSEITKRDFLVFGRKANKNDRHQIQKDVLAYLTDIRQEAFDLAARRSFDTSHISEWQEEQRKTGHI